MNSKTSNPGSLLSPQSADPKNNSNGSNKPFSQDVENNIIPEEDQEHVEEQSDQEKLDKDIKDFLKQSKIQMQRQGGGSNQIDIPRHLNGNGNNGQYKNITTKPNGNGGPTMKGNIGPTLGKTLIDGDISNHQKMIFEKMAEEFDIDKVIPKSHQMAAAPDKDASERSFELSVDKFEMESNMNTSDRNKFGAANTAHEKGFLQAPGLSHELDDESGLITSDSDFQLAEQAAGYSVGGQSVTDGFPKRSNDVKKDISKTFKKMLTSNHNRSNNSENKIVLFDPTNESTKYGGSMAKNDFEN